jgi:hypothetical protein
VTIAPTSPEAQSAAHQPFRRLLGRSTAREGVWLFRSRASHSTWKSSAPTEYGEKVRTTALEKVPSPLCTFLGGPPTSLGTSRILSDQRAPAQQEGHPLKFGTSAILSSSFPRGSSLGTRFAHTVVESSNSVEVTRNGHGIQSTCGHLTARSIITRRK